MKNIPLTIRRAILATVLMVAAAALAAAMTPTRKLADHQVRLQLEQAVPKSFGDWRVDDRIVPINPSPAQKSVLDAIYDQIISRTYVNSRGERMMISMAYGKSQTRQMRAHRQEVCYAAQGFTIKDLQRTQIRIGNQDVPVTRMVAENSSRVEPVTYWFTIGDSVVRGYLDRQLAQFRYSLSGYIPDGYLVRVSSLSTDSSEAFRSQQQFANELIAATPPALQTALAGAH